MIMKLIQMTSTKFNSCLEVGRGGGCSAAVLQTLTGNQNHSKAAQRAACLAPALASFLSLFCQDSGGSLCIKGSYNHNFMVIGICNYSQLKRSWMLNGDVFAALDRKLSGSY